MKFIIYKITNTINNKIYIGQHKTKNINDNYMGSGLLIKRAIDKYGDKNFKKDILFSFDNKEDMNKMEELIVDEEFISRADTYNLTVGGYSGACYYANEHKLNNTGNQIEIIRRLMDDPVFKTKWLKLVRNGLKKYYKHNKSHWIGKKHKEESKKKIGKANSKHQKGSGNSHYGKCWIYNLNIKKSISIKKEELNMYLSKGWIKGRKIKF